MQSEAHPLQALLEKRKQEGLLRVLRHNTGLVDFCSNDYLGFARNRVLAELAADFLKEEAEYMNGSTGSRLITGNTVLAEQLEVLIAAYHHTDAALLFNSGYDANLGFFSAVPQRGDTIFYDQLVHASIRDGMRLSWAKTFSFRHNDLSDLQRLAARASGNVYVAVESVYSMDGDLAPLDALAAICRKNGWHLVVDEAHATGVFGPQGEGLVNKALAPHCFARIYTYGKAMGVHGAAIAGSELLKDYLVNFARSFIYTTALPAHSLAMIQAAYTMMAKAMEERKKLHDNIAYFNSGMTAKLDFIPRPSAIQSVITGGNEHTRQIAAHIQTQGFDVRAILSPTVPSGQERLRICLHAFNTQEEIDRFIEFLKTCM